MQQNTKSSGREENQHRLAGIIQDVCGMGQPGDMNGEGNEEELSYQNS